MNALPVVPLLLFDPYRHWLEPEVVTRVNGFLKEILLSHVLLDGLDICQTAGAPMFHRVQSCQWARHQTVLCDLLSHIHNGMYRGCASSKIPIRKGPYICVKCTWTPYMDFFISGSLWSMCITEKNIMHALFFFWLLMTITQEYIEGFKCQNLQCYGIGKLTVSFFFRKGKESMEWRVIHFFCFCPIVSL